MFALTESMKYFIFPGYINFRKDTSGLYQLVKSEMKRNPLSGEVFLFFCKKRDAVKILHWENGGFVTYHKRLEEGTFELPRFKPDSGGMEISWRHFIFLMEGVSITSAKLRKRFNTLK